MDFDPPLKGWFSRNSLCYGVWVRVVAYIIKGGSGKKTGRGKKPRNCKKQKKVLSSESERGREQGAKERDFLL